MTRFFRFAVASLLSLAAVGAFAAGGSSARAALPYTVTVSPANETVAVGQDAVFRVKVEGQTANLPSFNFDVEGGTLSGIGSIDPTAANVAEGTVFVSRENEGTARLTVRFGSEVLATSQARFASMGTVGVNVTLDAGPDAAARTWRYEVVSGSGTVVATLVANTSGDAPNSVVSSSQLPYGFYTVRQVFGSDTRPTCGAGTFYQVSAPVSGQTTVELASAATVVNFTINPCPDLPSDLNVLIPVDTIVPIPGVVGEAEGVPADPISEVRGARDENPNFPLPPNVGDSPAPLPESHVRMLTGILLLSGLVTISIASLAWAATRLFPLRKQ